MSAFTFADVAFLNPPPPAGSRLIDVAAAWWTAKLRSGTTLLDQRGSNNLVASGSVAVGDFGNDGTYNRVSLRSATSQWLEASDNAALNLGSGDYTVVVVTKPTLTSGSKILFGKRFGAGIGWNMFLNVTTPTANFDSVGGSPVQATAANISTGTIYGLAARRSGSSLQLVRDGTAGTAQTVSGSVTNTEVLRVNRGSGTTTAYADQDFYGAAIFPGTAYTDAQTTQIRDELLAATAL